VRTTFFNSMNVISPAGAISAVIPKTGPPHTSLTKNDSPQNESNDRPPRGFCSWLFHDPCSHYPVFLYLAAGVFQGIAFAASMSGVDDMCVYALFAGIVVSLLASFYFYTIGTLRDQIENMEDQNEIFELQNNRLHEQLEQLEGELEAFHDLRDQFKKWGLSNYNSMVSVAKNFVSLFNSLAEVTKKQDEILLDNERMLLLKTAQDIEFSDGKPGMTQSQFTEFIGRIPSRLQPSWQQVRNNTYVRLRGPSGMIPRTNLNTAIDNLIQNQRKLVHETNNKQLRRMSVENIVELREEDVLKPPIRVPMKSRPSHSTTSSVKTVRSSRFTGAKRSGPRGRRTRSSLQSRNLSEQVIDPHNRMPGAQSPRQLLRSAPVQYPQQSSSTLRRGAR
jgi:hypothetical protein